MEKVRKVVETRAQEVSYSDYFCDVCGKKIDIGSVNRLEVLIDNDVSLDLCNDCGNDITIEIQEAIDPVIDKYQKYEITRKNEEEKFYYNKIKKKEISVEIKSGDFVRVKGASPGSYVKATYKVSGTPWEEAGEIMVTLEDYISKIKIGPYAINRLFFLSREGITDENK
jgi:transcription elongation factor Elf1